MYRVDAKDTDALGLSNAAAAKASAIQEGPVSDQTVWDQLKTVYDPEIPGNIRPYGSRSPWSCGSHSPTLLGVLVWGERNHVRPAPLLEGDAPIEWAQDGRHIFIAHETDEGATIFRVDVITGRRDVWKQIRPADPAGVRSVSRFYVTPSGNAYAYSLGRNLSALYVYSQK